MMIITTQTKIYLAIAVAFLAMIIGGSLWSNFRTARLERQVWDARRHAEHVSQTARTREIEAAEYKKKIEYLESQLIGIRELAKKQDDELEKLNTDTLAARDRLGRARRVRSVAATAAELCAKLAELGHPCD